MHQHEKVIFKVVHKISVRYFRRNVDQTLQNSSASRIAKRSPRITWKSNLGVCSMLTGLELESDEVSGVYIQGLPAILTPSTHKIEGAFVATVHNESQCQKNRRASHERVMLMVARKLGWLHACFELISAHLHRK
eukprot:528819-Hanusia_phi.AAC.2